MNDIEKQLFEKLMNDRKESAANLEKPSMRGLKTSVVEKYSDQAHFIYELIQNADDVGATEARFELLKDRLVFVHNGTRHFNVSDLEKEEEDTATGNLGDLNAITSIANSNKTSASIGKFGVGFKAVFQYTTTPYIYDPEISFKIERFIVPVIIEDTCDYKTKDETAFVFPFNHPDRHAEEAYEDIFHKLQNLLFPTLFLNNLRKISYVCGKKHGYYEKKVKETRIIENTVAERLEFINGQIDNPDKMWLFSRKTEENYKYSVGFIFDTEGKLKQTDYYAFCFFPTKKTTNLNFIINAPFLLTDSREGIKANDKHNVRMIELLAKLASDSFVYLRDIGLELGKMYIDDDILDYLPINEELYTPKNERDDISLRPFFEEIKKTFSTEKILPSFDEYIDASNAYAPFWAVISELFSNNQLAELMNNDDAKWVLPSKGYETYYRARDGKADYLRSVLGRTTNYYIEDLKIIELLTPSFIENQSEKWILKLYDFILETDRRVDKAKTAPIFINQKGVAMSAYDSRGVALLFLDDEDSKGYDTISSDYLAKKQTQKLIKSMDIKAPALKDKVYQKVLKKEELNPKADLRTLLNYFIELTENDESTYSFINQIKERSFLLGKSEDGTVEGTYRAIDLYYPNEELIYYFKGTGESLFLNLNEYESYLKKKEYKYFEDFLNELGIWSVVRRVERTNDEDEVSVFNVSWNDATRYREWLDYRIDCDEFVSSRIFDNQDKELSFILWQQLVYMCENNVRGYANLYLGGVYVYFNRTEHWQRYEGFGVKMLKEQKWLFNKTGQLCNVSDITIQDLDHRYDTNSEPAKRLLNLLGIKDAHPEYENYDENTRNRLILLDKFDQMGLTSLTSEQQKMLELFVEQQLFSTTTDDERNSDNLDERNKADSYEDKVIDDIKQRVKSSKKSEPINQEEDTSEADNEEITKAPIDYSKKIEQAKKKCEEEIAKLAQVEEAQERALQADKYSYGWFTALLDLEGMANGDENARSREASISFASVERESSKNRTLILKHPDKNIPQVMEELVDIPLELTFSDGKTKRLVIEVANVQSYMLRVKVKPDDFLNEADFSEVTQALIVAQNPTFLTRELQKEFAKFAEDPYGFADDFDMQQNLCDNIKFIFGPPGTGKTTYLAKDTLISLIQKEKKCRVLVLTPTNKAADVLVTRIMQVMGANTSYEDWLIRYGVTGDEEIEKSNVFHGKNIEINDYDKCVVVTTMARLPYDYFIDSEGNFNHLHGINWDYIVVDEASMIPLIQMVYMLYLKTPKKFIIAGDPFQIEPTTAVAEWKSENIYKMVHLEEFSEEADTIPHKYDITLLTTQYRSVESVGEVFSQLTYNGVLKHARSNDETRPLNIERYLEYENLNIIKFPVSKYESIYRPKRLKLSSFQIYSALFAYEFVVYMAKALARCNDDTFRIGVIAPYSAQAGLLDKLVTSSDIPNSVAVDVGTIHGFQGDECDIVIALFNPPPSIGTSKDMFLNRQNIVNVAISRAKDYLFVLLPDDETENVQNLFLINKLRRIIEKDFYVEKSTKELEELLFDDDSYLEKNAFSTGHQLVNVYGLPEKKYEIRSEENAVDVQVHGEVYYAPFAKADEEDRPMTIEELVNAVLEETVTHGKYGDGSVINCDGKYIEVEFESGVHTFSFPFCFDGHLTLNSNIELQEKILRVVRE
ncbi:MAG: AAA domain-containing protein [Lachnospira sp.]